MPQVWQPLFDTIKMSLLGSFIGSILVVPFAMLASTNIIHSRVIVAAILRNHRLLVPRGNMALQAGDDMVLGAESFHDDGEHIRLKEMVLQKNHPWIGQRIQELEISRQSIIVLVRRNKRVLIPNGNMILREADTVVLYTQTHVTDATEIEL